MGAASSGKWSGELAVGNWQVGSGKWGVASGEWSGKWGVESGFPMNIIISSKHIKITTVETIKVK